MYSVQYASLVWPLGHTTCRLQAAARYVNAFADWMSLGLVAFSRCLSLTKPKLCDLLFVGNGCYLAIFFIWIYSILLVLPSLLGLYGQIGYNVRLGKCDFVPTQSVSGPDILLYGVGFFVPFLIITISYIIILKASKKSTNDLRKYSQPSSDGSDIVTKKNSFSTMEQLRQRDLRLTRTILAICLAYILCVAPMTLLVLTGTMLDHPALELGFHCIYWFQYSINFIIYAARSEQFRAAYSSYLKHLHIYYCTKDTGRGRAGIPGSSGQHRAPITKLYGTSLSPPRSQSVSVSIRGSKLPPVWKTTSLYGTSLSPPRSQSVSVSIRRSSLPPVWKMTSVPPIMSLKINQTNIVKMVTVNNQFEEQSQCSNVQTGIPIKTEHTQEQIELTSDQSAPTNVQTDLTDGRSRITVGKIGLRKNKIGLTSGESGLYNR